MLTPESATAHTAVAAAAAQRAGRAISRRKDTTAPCWGRERRRSPRWGCADVRTRPTWRACVCFPLAYRLPSVSRAKSSTIGQAGAGKRRPLPQRLSSSRTLDLGCPLLLRRQGPRSGLCVSGQRWLAHPRDLIILVPDGA